MDDSQYVVCYGAKSVIKLVEQSASSAFRGRRSGRNFRGNFRGMGNSARGNGYRGRWNGGRGGFGGRFSSRYQRGSRGAGYFRSQRSRGSRWQSPSTSRINGQTAGGTVDLVPEGCPLNEEKCPVIDNVSVLGDSFALRLCKAVDESVTGKFVLCEGGLTMNQLKIRLEKCQSDDFKTNQIVVFMGMNDLRMIKSSDFDGELFSLLWKLKVVAGSKPLYLCTLPMLGGNYAEKISYFNETVRNVSKIDKNITIIDLESILLSNGCVDEQYYRKLYKSNELNIHPNAAGFVKIAEFILDSIVLD
ncbi:Caprin-1 [Frankliniella fusca]|uniref:Caprin-1 n=1 Tax=Frankliniella fusca TaxID=407009 RepID=A0AAE1L760_9NEOP|nr:Caprin-1 [Frankliniella fusca]